MSDDGTYSDLTDVEDEEEIALSNKTSTRSKSRSKAKEEGDGSDYRISNALKVPRATTFTCQSLHDQILAQDIDLQPEYQRAVVWPDSKQIGLIDSIFRNFYVPPVIFVVNYQQDGAERRVCVDGKQRLTSIYRFISGEIPFKDEEKGKKLVFVDTGKIKGASILPDRYKKLFLNKQIVCMEYHDITPANEREIFQRVQLGMALTPAERLQASAGPQADFVRDVLDTHILDRLAKHIEWDTSRAADFRGLATAIYAMSRWPHFNSTPSLAMLETWLAGHDDLDEDFCDGVRDTYEIFIDLAQDEKLSKVFRMLGVKKVAPVEFISISLLIYSNKGKMTKAQLSEAIGMMRTDIRKVEKDIRLNTRQVKQILLFLKGLKVSDLKPDKGNPIAGKSKAKTKTKAKAKANGSASTGKRKRPSHDPSPDPTLAPPLRSNTTTKSSTRSSSTATAPPSSSASTSVPPPPLLNHIRPPPSGPAVPRISNSNLPARPNGPPPPRPNTLGDNIMARMTQGTSALSLGTSSRPYDPSRTSRSSAHNSPSIPHAPPGTLR